MQIKLTPPPDAKLRYLLGPYNIKIYIKDNFLIVRRGSQGVIRSVVIFPNSLQGIELGEFGEYSEFSECSILLGGEHSGLKTCCFSGNPYISSYLNSLGDQTNVPTTNGGVCIGAGTVISYGATILSGAIIGSNSVVGAGAVVNKKFFENSVLGGVPAKVIGTKENKIEWWKYCDEAILGYQLGKISTFDESYIYKYTDCYILFDAVCNAFGKIQALNYKGVEISGQSRGDSSSKIFSDYISQINSNEILVRDDLFSFM